MKEIFLLLFGTVLAQVGNEKQNPNYESNPLSKAEKRVQAAQAKAEKWEKKLKLAEGRLKTMDMFPIKNITLKSALGSNEQEPVIDEDMKTIFIDGDMILNVKTEEVRDADDEARAVLNAVKEDIRLWPKDPKTKEVNIPFTIDRGYNATSMDLMYMGMKTIERFSCIRFRNRKREYDYVRIINMTNCAAMVGHTPGRNDVYLNEPGMRCMSKGTIMHELLHIVGFQHEQSRSDRDDYVDVIFDNIVQQAQMQKNFNRHDTKNLKPYLQTIIPRVFPHARLGQRFRLSPHDIEEVRSLYQCDESTYKRCGEDFESTHGKFQSPNFPGQYPQEWHCNWLLTASKNKYMELTIQGVDMPATPACEEDSIIIHDGPSGASPELARVCGKQQSMTIKSSGQYLYVLFASAPIRRNGFKGFSASFREVSSPGIGAPPIIGNDYGLLPAGTDSEFKCAFSSNRDPFCGMTMDGLLYDFKWQIMKNYSKNKKTGPQPPAGGGKPPGGKRAATLPRYDEVGNDYANQHAYKPIEEAKYMYAPSSGREIGDRARIMTPWLTPTPKCIQFMYYLFGGSMGSLHVVAVEMDNTGDTFERTITEIHGNQGAQFNTKKTNWETAGTNIRAVKFIFDANIYGDESDIVVDNIEVTEGCSAADIVLIPTFNCDFENGDKCGAIDDEAGDFSWLMNSGVTPSKSTGPLGDHTTGRSNGQYLFIEASQPRVRGDLAKLTTPPLTEELHCLSFWYHMYGEETGSMRVRIKIGKNGRDRIIWEENGEKPDKWFKAEIEINPKYFLNDIGGLVTAEAEERENDSTVSDRDALNTAAGQDGDIVYDDENGEDLENDYALFDDDEQGEFDDANEFNYEFEETIEGSSRRRRQAEESWALGLLNGILITKYDLLSMAALLEDPDDCSAGINETNSCAMQNDAVNFKKIKEKGLYVTIEAERGHGYRGDSALDDIKITNMPCSTWAEWSNWGSCSKSCGGGIQTRSRQCFLNNKLKCDGKFKEEQTCSMHVCGGWSCSFDDGMCGITQMKDDDFDFERHTGYTPSALTGPTRDVSGKGFYMFIEASSPQKTGDKARLQTPWFPIKTDYCLTFYYHMWGDVADMPQAVGSLIVFILLKGSQGNHKKEVFAKRDDQGKQWHRANVNLANLDRYDAFSLVFQAQRGYSYRSDIALDEITLTNTNCDKANDLLGAISEQVAQEQNNLDEEMKLCTFNWNKGQLCGWQQLKNGKFDDGDFIRTNEATPSKLTGPEQGTGVSGSNVDRGDEKDYFLFIEGSDLNEGEGAVLQSVNMAPIPYCLSLDYHMYGKGTGSLTVLAEEIAAKNPTANLNVNEEEEIADEEESGVRAARQIAQVKYDQGNMWHPWEVTFIPQFAEGVKPGEVIFYIRATRGKTWASDIAIDNLQIKPGPCINMETVESRRFVASWDSMSDLVNYDIKLEPETSGFINGNTTLNKMDVSELNPETVYNLTVVTNLASGRTFTNFKSIKTMPELQDIAVGFTRSTEMKVKWLHNPKFIGYRLSMFPAVEGFNTDIRLGNQTSYDVTGLQANTQYAITCQGIGEESTKHVSNIVRKYFKTAPPAPIMIMKPQTDQIELIWESSYQLSALKVSPVPPSWPPSGVKYLPKGTTNEIIRGLNPSTAYNAEIFGLVGYANAFKPTGAAELLKSLQAPFAILTDVEQIAAQTAPVPPTLKLEDRRDSSVRVTWSDFKESEEVSFLVRLNPSNDQFYSDRDIDISETSIMLENLNPEIEYTLQVVAKFESHRKTNPVTKKIRVNCDQSHFAIKTSTRLGPYKFGSSWTMCGWVKLAGPGGFLQLVTQTQRILAATMNPDGSLVIDFGPDQNGLPRVANMQTEPGNLEYLCVVKNGEEGIMNVYHKSQRVQSIIYQSEDFIGMAMFKGPLSLIDFNVWDFPLGDFEVSLQQRGQCISGMSPPKDGLPPSNAPRVPLNPKYRIREILSSEVKIDLAYSGLLSGIYMELQPSTVSFRNGIQSEKPGSLEFTHLEPGTQYELKFGSILAGESAALESIRFSTTEAAPSVSLPQIRSSSVGIQWSKSSDLVESYLVKLPDKDIVIRADQPTYYTLDMIEGNTDYSVSVQGIISTESTLIATDCAKYNFKTAPYIENFSLDAIYSTSFVATWSIQTPPGSYRVLISPDIVGFDNGIREIDGTSLNVEGARPNSEYTLTLVGLFAGSESDPIVVNFTTAPLIADAAVKTSRSTMMLIGWSLLPGARDVYFEINPPMQGPTAIENGPLGSIKNMITLMGLQPVTKYEIKVSMIFDDQRRTDSAIIIQETAPSSSGLEISKIESTAFSLSWDAIDNVANYNIVIKPNVDGFNGTRDANDRSIRINTLEPETAYTVFVSGTLFNGIQTDPTASKATTTPRLGQTQFTKIRSTEALIQLDSSSEYAHNWLIHVTDDLDGTTMNEIEWLSADMFRVNGLSPGRDYSVSIQADYETAKSDLVIESFSTAPDSPTLELRNVQSTAFNILWFKQYQAANYRIIIEPPVDDFENGLLDIDEDESSELADHLSVYEAVPGTNYKITLSAIMADNIETDSITEYLTTAFEMQDPVVNDITETSAMVTWSAISTEVDTEETSEDATEPEGSGFDEIEVDFNHRAENIKVISYRININPPVEGINSRTAILDTNLNLDGLEPATEYRFELIAILTTGAETDLVEAIFVTAGEKAEVEKSQCALSYEALINSNDIITACDFEDGTLCGWSQKRVRGGKNYLWRIDTERSVAVNEKSKSKTDIIIQTGRPGNGKVLVAPFTKHSKNTEAKLYSQLLTGPTCLRLEVLMFRRNVNYLSIKIIHKEAQTSSEIVRYNGPQGQQWVPMEHSIFLPESLSYQIEITAGKGTDWRSTIALDNVRVTRGPCWST